MKKKKKEKNEEAKKEEAIREEEKKEEIIREEEKNEEIIREEEKKNEEAIKEEEGKNEEEEEIEVVKKEKKERGKNAKHKSKKGLIRKKIKKEILKNPRSVKALGDQMEQAANASLEILERKNLLDFCENEIKKASEKDKNNQNISVLNHYKDNNSLIKKIYKAKFD